MRLIHIKTLVLSLSLSSMLLCPDILAEGTPQLAPNSRININGNETNDVAALLIGNASYNDFAKRGNNESSSRLHINIQNPDTESIYLGFSKPRQSNSNIYLDVDFWIVDPNGKDVFGPYRIDSLNHQINNWSEAINGSYQPIEILSEELTSEGWSGPGDYYIEFRNRSNSLPILIDYWDISVVSSFNNSVKPGRVWAYNWALFAINDFGFPNRPFNGAFYVAAANKSNTHANITRIDFNGSGFRPGAFNFAFNSFGLDSTEIISVSRQSIENRNSTQSEYAIFLNDPIDIYQTEDQTFASIDGLAKCSDEGFEIHISSNNSLNADLLIDLHQDDGLYTPGTEDLLLPIQVDFSGQDTSFVVYWDGFDGLSANVNNRYSGFIPIKLLGGTKAFHFPVYDAEFLTEGFYVEQVRPKANALTRLYYDDRNIDSESGTNQDKEALNGCVPRCHNWTEYVSPNQIGYGNRNTINTWWYSGDIEVSEKFRVPGKVISQLTGDQSLCPGEVVTIRNNFRILPTTNGSVVVDSIVWSGPSILSGENTLLISCNQSGSYICEIYWTNDLGYPCVTQDSFVVYDYFQDEARADTKASVIYGFDDCKSSDYSRLEPLIIDEGVCVSSTATHAYNLFPETNLYSCTAGLGGTEAICIGADQECNPASYDNALHFDVTFEPYEDYILSLDSITFYHKSPLSYNWTTGQSGTNNNPAFFKVLILAGTDTLIELIDLPTGENWDLFKLDKSDLSNASFDGPIALQVKILPYCTSGVDSPVSAWDLEDLVIHYSCFENCNNNISGLITTQKQSGIEGAYVSLIDNKTEEHIVSSITDENGQFLLNRYKHEDVRLSIQKEAQALEGLTSLDMLLIKAHILGVKPFSRWEQKEAADLNQDKQITVSDLLEMRNVILGVSNRFSSNKVWYFSSDEQNASANNEILLNESDFENTIQIKGIKLGDVSNN